mmetsp:Transcript_44644/g.105893  ORF Transcript_44644/g.105893 Transcript_44644/m.105893 type:complete len:273 (+) Transcript_44644:73-891(+)
MPLHMSSLRMQPSFAVMLFGVLVATSCGLGAGLAVLNEGRQAVKKIDNNHVQIDFYFGPMCGYCHEWALQELRPLWNDPDFQPLFGHAVKIRPHALVLSHIGHMEAQALLALGVNCAADHLDGKEVVETLVCMEERLSHDHSAHHIVDKCFLTNANSKNNAFKGCVESHSTTAAAQKYQTDIMKHAPSGFVDKAGYFMVPYFSVGGSEQRSIQSDLKSYLCSNLSNSQQPKSCGGSSGGSSSHHTNQCDDSHPCLYNEQRPACQGKASEFRA